MPILQLQISRLLLLLFMLVLISFGATAQQEKPQTLPLSSPVVTAASSADHIRFTAPGNIVAIRLEVYTHSGDKVFDSGERNGNVIDWNWRAPSLALSADPYLCVVTVRSLSGKTSRKLANASFANQSVTLQKVDASQLSSEQTQTLSATDSDTPLAIIDDNQAIAATVIAHDGSDGQIARTRGALIFRSGDFFTGTDAEQMRLTEEGNLG